MGQKRQVQVYVLVTEDTIEERMLATLSAKHDLAMAALDVESDVTEVELQSGLDELKKRLEKLLGNTPAAPIDVSQQREVEAEANRSVHRDRVASASGQLLGAALNLVGELVNPDYQPDEKVVGQIREGLSDCTERTPDGRLQLRFTLENEEHLQSVAATLAKLLLPTKTG
jgi:hypothetical protein